MTSLNEIWKKAVADTEGKDALTTRQKFMELSVFHGYPIRELFNYLLSIEKKPLDKAI